MKADRIRLAFVILVIGVAMLALLWPDATRTHTSWVEGLFGNIRLGLDIRGGSRLDYSLRVPDDATKSIDEIANEVVFVVRQRLDAANYTEAEIIRVGSGPTTRIRVEIPGVDDPSVAERLVGRQGTLYFGEILETTQSETEPRPKVGIQYRDAQWIRSKDFAGPATTWYLILPYARIGSQRLHLDGSKVSDARAEVDPQRGGFKINLTFDREGTDLFGRITANFVQQQLPIILDDLVLVAPVVQNVIREGRAEISGRFTAQEAMELAALIKSGNLPADLVKEEERTLGPTLGMDIVTASMIAGLFGLLIVLIYMIVYYRVMGLVADIALVYNTFLLLGVMSAGQFILTLPGIAGIILTIGTTVDGNIIVFERIREEMRSGKTTLNAIAGGYSKAFSTILDSNVTTILAAFVLFYMGTGPIKGFANTLIIGVLGSMFVTLVVSRLLLDGLHHKIENSFYSGIQAKAGDQ